jgi:hypothetical protein
MKRARQHKPTLVDDTTRDAGLLALGTKLAALQSRIPAGTAHAPPLSAEQMLINSTERNVDVIRNIVRLIPSSSQGIVTTTPVSREWEEKYMREAYGNERRCLSGELPMGCWASRLHQNARGHRPGQPQAEKLVLKEFYTPDEHVSLEASGWKWPETRRLCVLCTRVATHEMFIQARASNKQIPSDVGFARVSNIVDLPGEYLATDCFVSAPDRFEGVIDPVVIPRLVDYDVCTTNGVRQVIQKLGYPGRVSDDWSWRGPTDFRH